MTRSSIIAVVLSAACGGNRVETTPAQRAQADSIRGQRLAVALKSGAATPRPDMKSSTLTFPVDAARAGQAGSAIIAFVVLPNGRVDRDTRTVVYAEGHPIYAKHICDFLNAAKFESPPPDEKGAVGVMPIFFSIQGGASRDSASAAFANAQRILRTKFSTMTEAEAQVWFARRPNCSAIKIGIDPLYGGPP